MADGRAPAGQAGFKIRPLWPENKIPTGEETGLAQQI